MKSADISCYKFDCAGEFRFVGDDDSADLFRCVDCGAQLRQGPIEELAQGDDMTAELAEVLLGGGPE